jgi:hypothetical protein
MRPAKIEGIEEVQLVVCNVRGVDLLFTSDGKLLPNQGSGGHIYYIDSAGEPRYKTFRTSFLVDYKKLKIVDYDDFLKRLERD